MKISKLIFLSTSLLLSFSSCKKDKTEDKEDPTISISSPANHSTHQKGSSIHVHADFADDIDLASYHVHMSDNAAGSSHSSLFDFHESSSISGKSYEFHTDLTVPDSTLTVHWLHFEVIDAEGKTTTNKVMLHF